MNLETTIGLEIHTQLNTATKAWCNCELKVNGFENNYVCEVCSAQPGTLPVMNSKSIEHAIKLGLALNCEINKVSFFDRKNYFYPDLPKGYQVTQFEKPIGVDGHVEITKKNGETKSIRIERIQLEEDTGKSTHYDDYSLINLNRAGTPLIEIVTKPDFKDEEESVLFLKKLQSILVYLGVSKANMQDGNLRCDVNLSMSEIGSAKLGTRTEVKNLNSFKSVEKAIKHERSRHTQLIESGEEVLQQTLLFNVETGKTKVLRTKSDADDYRYHREPDLLPLVLSEMKIQNIKAKLPELPDAKIKRFVKEFEIPHYDAEVICSDKELGEYFENACLKYNGKSYKLVSNWVMGELLRVLNEYKLTASNSKVSPESLVELIMEVENGKVSGTVAKEIFEEMFDTGKKAKSIISEKGLEQNSNESELENIVRELVNKHPDEVEQLKSGRDRIMGFFVGQVMKATQGKANPKMTSEIVKKIVNES